MAISVIPVSSLVKIFSHEALSSLPRTSRLSLLCGEKSAVQFAVVSDSDCETEFSVDCALPVEAGTVREKYSDRACIDDRPANCTVLNNADIGFYPDLIEPACGKLTLEKGKTLGVYCEVCGAEPGTYPLVFKAGGESAAVEVYVSSAKMPVQTLMCTNWFHTDCIMSYYGIEAFSDEYWRITENFVRNAVSHGINMILTPVFTLALDTAVGSERPTVQLIDVTKKGYDYTFDYANFDRWVAMCLDCGVKYFEISHLFTQWGAKHAPKIMAHTSTGYRRIFGWETNSVSRGYMSFLRQLGASFKEHTDALGITDICYVHCSDEPGGRDIVRYRRCAAAVGEFFSAFVHMDALSDYKYYSKGLVDLPVPCESDIDKFRGRVDRLWTYYCCGPFENEYPNRFLFLPLVKMRVIGVLLYKYGCEGFLHWGFNFWYSQFSRRPVDPFTETTAGGNFPAGDGFIVYPGENGRPMCSIREKSFRDGVRDYEALKALEKKKGARYAADYIKRTLGDITFTSYPLDTAVFEEFANGLAKELE